MLFMSELTLWGIVETDVPALLVNLQALKAQGVV